MFCYILNTMKISSKLRPITRSQTTKRKTNAQLLIVKNAKYVIRWWPILDIQSLYITRIIVLSLTLIRSYLRALKL